ncbi:MAG: hypothetical protein M1330_02635 [Armatimonadetes bacterium]|nr:hypothetical protein [Armatimonadota bacterium]
MKIRSWAFLAIIVLVSPRLASASNLDQSVVNAVVRSTIQDLDKATDLHWHEGEYNHIINLYRMIIAAEPYHLEAYSNCGWLLWSMNRDKEALAIYHQGLKANPNNYYMYDELGEYYFLRQKNYNKAAEWYGKAVKFTCPAFTWHMYAHSLEHNGDLKGALKAWKYSAKHYKGDAAAVVNYDRVRKELESTNGASSK